MLKRLFRISAPILLAAVVGCGEEPKKDSNPGTPQAGEPAAPAAKPGARTKTPVEGSNDMPSNKMVD